MTEAGTLPAEAEALDQLPNRIQGSSDNVCLAEIERAILFLKHVRCSSVRD